MFYLEKEINKWKKSLRKSSSLEDGYIEELESHLREEINNEVENGKSEEEAFTLSVSKLGNTGQIADQYYKSDSVTFGGNANGESSRLTFTLWLNYVKIAIRNIKKHKGYSAINILGLAAGLSCVILISMIIRYELSYDNFHKNFDRIYKVYNEATHGSDVLNIASVMLPFIPAVKEDIPEIEYGVRVSQKNILSSYDDNSFYETVLYVDQEFFEVFSFQFIKGDPSSVLVEPNTVVISERAAEKYFGESDPVGKSLKFNNNEYYRITGLLKNLPKNSHIRGDIFASFNSFNPANFPQLVEWGSFSNDYAYITILPNTDPKTIETKFEETLTARTKGEYSGKNTLKLMLLKDVHFSISTQFFQWK